MTHLNERTEKTAVLSKTYRSISLMLSVIFAVVGLIFLIAPDTVVLFFNTLSPSFGLPESPVQATGLYLVLAVGYMYLVAMLACLMYRHPENPYFPLLLINGKAASSVVSLLYFIFHQPYLIFISNCIVDGLIAAVVVVLYRKIKIAPK